MLDATAGKGVDLIVDQVSASVADGNLKAAAVLGRIVNVGRLGGFKGEFDFDLHAMKRIDYIGVTFRTRSVEEVREINAARPRRPVGRHRKRQAAAADRPRLPSRPGGSRARPHARQCPLRQDRADGLKRLAYDGQPQTGVERAMSSKRQGPLSRFKVIDLTRARAGPTAARHFADWGADVIKVEIPQDGAART